MPATTPNVGVRTFFDRVQPTPFLIADMSTIGGVFDAVGVNTALFPPDQPVHFTTDDAAMVAGAGTSGTLRETLDAITAEGVHASLVAVVPQIPANATADQRMAAMVGSPSSRTGAYALLSAEAETGATPDLLIGPGYTSQRPGNAANPLATAFDAIAERLITAMAICDTPSGDKTSAIEWAADFAETLNIIAIGQSSRVSVGGLPVIRPSSASIAALMVRTDKEQGAPYYQAGNTALRGVLGPNRAVGFNPSDPDCEANFMLQRGVNSLVQLVTNRTSRRVNSPQGKTFWGFFNTSSDPVYRQYHMVRVRKAIREVIPRTLVRYTGKNLGPHLGVTLMRSLAEFVSELLALPEPPILGGEVDWKRSLNSNATLATGGFVVNLNAQETPALLDLQVRTGTFPAAFDILASEIQAAMAQFQVTGQISA